jgi:hypothetical protein
MLQDYNPKLESKNYIDGVDFTKDDPCVWVVYPAGASGDLLISIIDKHYIRSGCEYYGIEDSGRVHAYTTDYEIISLSNELGAQVEFNDQWFWNLSNKLAERNLNYSLLDQIIFGCHLHDKDDIKKILETFPKAKIINIYIADMLGREITRYLHEFKREKNKIELLNATNNAPIENKLASDNRVLNIPYGCLFNEEPFELVYQQIVDFLELSSKLIRYEYISYYLSKQPAEVRSLLNNYKPMEQS